MDVKGRVALITGAKRIGAIVAEELARRGVDIALSYHRSRKEAEETASRVHALGQRALTVRADVARREDRDALVARAAQELGRLDILINMASIYEGKPFAELTEQDWDRCLAVDLKAAFLCSRAALPHLRATKGRIINFSDWLPASGRPGIPAIFSITWRKGASKRSPRRSRSSSRPIGSSSTPSLRVQFWRRPKHRTRSSKAVETATPLGTWGGGLEIAKAVLALLDSDFITGETIRVDGGRHIR
jgi:NAD(P)-dependent dehydrogenase (short-subunit alcohol dehydrogenase family)